MLLPRRASAPTLKDGTPTRNLGAALRGANRSKLSPPSADDFATQRRLRSLLLGDEDLDGFDSMLDVPSGPASQTADGSAQLRMTAKEFQSTGMSRQTRRTSTIASLDSLAFGQAETSPPPVIAKSAFELQAEKNEFLRKAVSDSTRYEVATWIGKIFDYEHAAEVESDAVFFPERLRSALLEADAKSEDAGPPLPGPLGLFSQSRRLEAEQTGSAGTFVTSCRRQLHGPMEILSRDAVTKFAEERTQCEKRMALDTESDFLQSCLIQVGSLQLDVNSDVLASEECQTVHWKQCQSSHVAFALHADVPGYKACVVSATQVDGGRRLSR